MLDSRLSWIMHTLKKKKNTKKQKYNMVEIGRVFLQTCFEFIVHVNKVKMKLLLDLMDE